MGEQVDLFNPNDGLVGRDGGPYLDVEEARLAETRRASIEGRKPDYDNLSGVAGIPLVTANQLVANAVGLNIPSRDGTDVLTDANQKFAASDAVAATPMASVPKDVYAVPDENGDAPDTASKSSSSNSSDGPTAETTTDNPVAAAQGTSYAGPSTGGSSAAKKAAAPAKKAAAKKTAATKK
jgi:hypothetical protein